MDFGVKCRSGTRPYMQDRYSARCLGTYQFYSVYDGHGENGGRVAQHCADNLCDNLERLLGAGLEMGVALRDAFLLTDDTAPGASESGCTAAVAIVNDHEIWTAHCGDSRVIVGRSRGGELDVSTEDHHPTRDDEHRRVTESDGCVVRLEGTSRVMGVLAVSRALGDHDLRRYGVIPEPEIKQFARAPEDDFLLLATDGLTSVISNEDAASLLRRSIDRAISRGVGKGVSARIAANVLTRVAECKGLRDNLTVLVVNLAS